LHSIKLDIEDVNLRGKAIWVLGFFSFLSGLNAIAAVILAIDLGIEATFKPYLIDSLIGGLPVYVYLIASIVATLIFLGGTAAKVVDDLSDEYLLNQVFNKTNDLENSLNVQQSLLESLKARVFLVDESLNAARKEIAKGFTEQDKEIKQVHTSLGNRIDSKLADLEDGVTTQVGEGINKQGELLKQYQNNLVKRFDSKITDVNDSMVKQLATMDESMRKYATRVRRSTNTLIKQTDEIENIKLKLTEIENDLAKPKPELNSQSDIEEVRGIGKQTGDELRAVGITNVGEFILTEANVVAEKTTTSEKMVEKLQGRAQLALVPGITEKDMILLEEVGVINRKDLANQDAIELGKKIAIAFKSCVEEGRMAATEKPTIEEIDSWIKFAKT
jgi:predicted flap endonuclease-1-like 5' DNA nuclease